MENNWHSIERIEQQEIEAKKAMENFFGKGRKGFCDYALDGIDLMIKGVLCFRDTEIDKYVDVDKVKYNDFRHALRIFSYYHYYRIIFSFKAAYNLLLQGYYTESAFLMRHIVETFVRLKYIAKKQNEDLVNLAFAGHGGLKGKKFNVTYEKQFDEIAPGLYKYYRILCDISHGAIASYILKSDLSAEGEIQLDPGIVFKSYESTYVINQFSIYLLAHIEFMKWVFPEINKNRSESYAKREHEVLAFLWSLMEQISENDRNKLWYDAVKQFVNV